MSGRLSNLIEPIARYEGRETLGEIVAAWNPGVPVAVHRGTWHLLTPGAAAGYPLTRRLVDLPLTEALVFAPDLRMEDALAQLTERGLSFAPVRDGERLLGLVRRQRLEEFALTARSRRAEDDSRRSETRLDLVLAASGTGVWEWKIDTKCLVASPETRELLGLASPLGNFEAIIKAVHPEDMAAIIARAKRAVAENAILAEEFRICRPDGEVRWLSGQGQPQFDAGGNLLRIVGTLCDITDRKCAEEALRLSEERFRDLAELLPQIVYEADLEGRLTFVNRESLQMFGYTREDVEAGLNCFHTLAAKDRDRAREMFLRAAQGEDVGGVEFTAQRKDGTQFPVMIHGVQILRDGATVGVRGIIIDLTERTRFEESLRESEERFRLTFDQLPIGAAISSLDYRFVRVNEMLCRITGYSSEELIRHPFPDITHPDDRVRDLQLAQRLVAGEIDHYEIDKRYIRKDGKVVWIRLVSRLAKTASGQPLYFLPTMQDITGRKLAEERMREAERLSADAERLAIAGRMAAQVAHEINNPLAGIKNSFRLIKNAVPADHPDRDMVGRIEREIDRIARIVRQMYQIYSPRVEERIDISVRETVRDVVEMLEPLRRQHEVTIEMETIPPELTVRAYEGSLQQVLFNLTVNALQASPARGKVEISAIPTDNNFVEILVCDHGHGISAEIQDRIFEPFFSTESVDSTKKGLGLGLPIVKTIVSNLGGKIDFQSTIGEGTCFRVYLPRKQL